MCAYTVIFLPSQVITFYACLIYVMLIYPRPPVHSRKFELAFPLLKQTPTIVCIFQALPRQGVYHPLPISHWLLGWHNLGTYLSECILSHTCMRTSILPSDGSAGQMRKEWVPRSISHDINLESLYPFRKKNQINLKTMSTISA